VIIPPAGPFTFRRGGRDLSAVCVARIAFQARHAGTLLGERWDPPSGPVMGRLGPDGPGGLCSHKAIHACEYNNSHRDGPVPPEERVHYEFTTFIQIHVGMPLVDLYSAVNHRTI